jgi:hypothetical protein
LLAQRRRAQFAGRAQQVVLAAAIFDKDGKLMVTPEGLLPSQKITNSFNERVSAHFDNVFTFRLTTLQSFDDVFGIAHPVFLWIFRTTRNWEAIKAFVPSMRRHINNISVLGGSQSSTSEPTMAKGTTDDYSIIFRELFCVAAADLAEQLNQPLENVGILFDEILSTGQSSKFNAKGHKATPSSSADMEQEGLDPQVFGRGQLLFVTRRASQREAENFQNAGFRFAWIHNVVDILARTMQIHSNDLTGQLTNMRDYSNGMRMVDAGVHIAYFAIRANVRRGFEVLVRKDAKNQLPTKMLPSKTLDNWQVNYLSQLDGMSVSACLGFLKGKGTIPDLPKREQTFVVQLHDTLEALRDEIDDPLFLEAALVARPVLLPSAGTREETELAQAPLIAFRLIVPIHSPSPSAKLEFIPLSFFKMQQLVYENSPDHAVFARKIHREFGPILHQPRSSIGNREAGFKSLSSLRLAGSNKSLVNVHGEPDPKLPNLMPSVKVSEPRRSLRFWKKSHQGNRQVSSSLRVSMRDDASSEKNLVETQSFGGILVSQEVTVDVQEPGLEMVDLKTGSGKAAENTRMGTLGVASTEVEDPETYVDRLFALCVETR